MLKDLDELLDKPVNRNLTPDDFAAAADRLLRTQFIFREDWGDRGIYDLLMAHRGYFEKLFSALGRDLIVSPHEQMIGLLPQRPTARTGFSLEETVLLLMLRFLYDEALSRFEAGDLGEVGTTTMDLLEKFETVTGRQRPDRTRVRQILESFQRRRLVQIGEAHPEELGWDLIIRPAIRIVAGQAWLKRLEDFAQSEEARATLGLPPGADGEEAADRAAEGEDTDTAQAPPTAAPDAEGDGGEGDSKEHDT